MIGWVVVGLAVGLAAAAVVAFWNRIAFWLNNTAADAVERVLGYDAKKFMHRAVATVTKVRDKLMNQTVIYTRQSALDTHIQKVTLSSSAPFYEQEKEVQDSFEKENTQTYEFKYEGQTSI